MGKEEEKLQQANVRLKTAKIGVAVFRKGNRLYLRATLPPKPGVERDRSYQQDVSLGIYASEEGVKRAELEAKTLGYQLAKGTFTWAEWLKGPQQLPDSIGRWIAKFSEVAKVGWSLLNLDNRTGRNFQILS